MQRPDLLAWFGNWLDRSISRNLLADLQLHRLDSHWASTQESQAKSPICSARLLSGGAFHAPACKYVSPIEKPPTSKPWFCCCDAGDRLSRNKSRLLEWLRAVYKGERSLQYHRWVEMVCRQENDGETPPDEEIHPTFGQVSAIHPARYPTFLNLFLAKKKNLDTKKIFLKASSSWY